VDNNLTALRYSVGFRCLVIAQLATKKKLLVLHLPSLRRLYFILSPRHGGIFKSRSTRLSTQLYCHLSIPVYESLDMNTSISFMTCSHEYPVPIHYCKDLEQLQAGGKLGYCDLGFCRRPRRAVRPALKPSPAPPTRQLIVFPFHEISSVSPRPL
jgi:hypothetical protein